MNKEYNTKQKSLLRLPLFSLRNEIKEGVRKEKKLIFPAP